jgi:hypothetical protein
MARPGFEGTLVKFNKRLTGVERRLNASPSAGLTTERDVVFGVPATVQERAALANRQVVWLNRDTGKGWLESYYAPTGTAGLVVPGLVTSAAAGWYPLVRGPRATLTASGPQSFAGAGDFTNWQAWGFGNSYRNDTAFGVSSQKLSTTRPGRYRATGRMDFPAGSRPVMRQAPQFRIGSRVCNCWPRIPW